MLRRTFCKVLLAAVAVFGLLVLSGVLLAQDRSDSDVENAIKIQERYTDKLMALEGVVGTAIGLDQNDRLVIKVYTTRTAVLGIPTKLDKVPVEVVVTGKIYALKPPEAQVPTTIRFPRPVPIGVSTGHPDITAGTIGCRVTDGTNVYALSNNHVYANQNDASIGDNVLQPGALDGGIDPDDAIGTLYDFVPINFDGSNNIFDAAIALSSTELLGKRTLRDGYGMPKRRIVRASLGQKVMKYGRTTRLTMGDVTGVNATVNVYYDATKVARFVKQIIITGPGAFSEGGDSGSLIVSDTGLDARKPVGLLFAGNATITVANPILAVLNSFGVTIDGE